MLPAFAKRPGWHPAGVQPLQVQLLPGQRRAPVLAADHRAAGAAPQLARRRASSTALPPILTFQSVADATVSTPAVLAALYAQLPANGSEIVLFDINRNAEARPAARARLPLRWLDRLLPPGAAPLRRRSWSPTPRPDAGCGGGALVRGRRARRNRCVPLGIDWPHELYSLSHVALPFPVSDGLYGARAGPGAGRGFRHAARRRGAARRTRRAGASTWTRWCAASSNPFFPYLMRAHRSGPDRHPRTGAAGR